VPLPSSTPERDEIVKSSSRSFHFCGSSFPKAAPHPE
jgi:hypothetical protein